MSFYVVRKGGTQRLPLRTEEKVAKNKAWTTPLHIPKKRTRFKKELRKAKKGDNEIVS